jgi:hypothetical protein
MSSILYGVGSAFIKDASNNAFQFGVLQDVSVDFQVSTKPLYGSNGYPVDVAATERKVTGKIKFAQFEIKTLGSLLGGTTTAGRKLANVNHTVSASSSITVTPTGSGFYADLGVLDNNGNAMTLTGSAPQVGAYAVNTSTGVYTFNASETGSLQISYQYSSTSGYTLAVNNAPMGQAQTYELTLWPSYKGESASLRLFAVTIPKLALALKNNDHLAQDLEFEAFANTQGKVFEFSGE